MIARTWQRLSARFNAATPRERAGLAVAAAACAFALALTAFDGAMAGAAGKREASAQRIAAEAMLSRDSDPAFQQTLGDNANKVWRWSIVEASEGLVRAQAVAHVEALTLQAGLVDAEIVVGEPLSSANGIGAVPVRIAASFDWQSLQALLRAIEEAEVDFGITEMEVVQGGDAPTLTMSLRAPYLLEAAQ